MATRTLFCDPPQDAVLRAPALVAVRNRQSLLLSAFFLALIGLPFLATVFGIDTAVEEGEKRELAPSPTLEATWSSINSYGARLQKYFQDNFGFRARLVRAHGILAAKVLNVSPSPTVLWGREGWLYYADDGGLDDIIAETPFSDAELEGWRATLVDNERWLRARGVEYVFMLAPDKHALYPEYLPAGLHRLGTERRMEQLAAYLRKHTDLVLADALTTLREARAADRLYDRTDTHWNRRGAYVAYRTLIDTVAGRVAGVEPAWPLADFTPRTAIAPGKDLAIMLGLADILPEEELSYEPVRRRRARVVEPAADPTSDGDVGRLVTEIASSNLPRAVVFRDSFMSRVYPYVSEHFSRTVYLWQNDVDPSVVLKERPAVVIHEIVGRHLVSLVPYDWVRASSPDEKRDAP
jgi:alginate O-acetyltransferase complex protein AlgJ